MVRIILPRYILWRTWGWVVFEDTWAKVNNFKFDDMKVVRAGFFIPCLKRFVKGY